MEEKFYWAVDKRAEFAFWSKTQNVSFLSESIVIKSVDWARNMEFIRIDEYKLTRKQMNDSTPTLANSILSLLGSHLQLAPSATETQTKLCFVSFCSCSFSFEFVGLHFYAQMSSKS